MSGDPFAEIANFKLKSGAKEIFEKAGIPVPIGVSDVRTKEKFYEEFSRLVANNLFS